MRRMKTTDGPSAASHNDFGVRGLVRAFGKRLVAVECGKASNSPGPLDAALLWRQVAEAAKAVTSHRTPNPCRLGAKFHHCSAYKSGISITLLCLLCLLAAIPIRREFPLGLRTRAWL